MLVFSHFDFSATYIKFEISNHRGALEFFENSFSEVIFAIRAFLNIRNHPVAIAAMKKIVIMTQPNIYIYIYIYIYITFLTAIFVKSLSKEQPLKFGGKQLPKNFGSQK